MDAHELMPALSPGDAGHLRAHVRITGQDGAEVGRGANVEGQAE
jgi:hypothetical protein